MPHFCLTNNIWTVSILIPDTRRLPSAARDLTQQRDARARILGSIILWMNRRQDHKNTHPVTAALFHKRWAAECTGEVRRAHHTLPWQPHPPASSPNTHMYCSGSVLQSGYQMMMMTTLNDYLFRYLQFYHAWYIPTSHNDLIFSSLSLCHTQMKSGLWSLTLVRSPLEQDMQVKTVLR